MNPRIKTPNIPSPYILLLLSLILTLLLPFTSCQSQPLPKTSPSTPTQQARTLQQNNLLSFYRQNQFVALNQQFGFELKQSQQFNFHLPTNHDIHFLIRIYVLRNNAYLQIPDIQHQPAMHVVVYENNHKIVVQRSLYFQGIITVNGKQGSTYMIRFYSPTSKLITVSHNNFIQTSYLQDKIQTSDLQKKTNKIRSVDNKLQQIFKNLKFTYFMQMQSRTQFTNKTSKYANFQIVQMLLLIALCIFQIKLVGKLFKSQSIV